MLHGAEVDPISAPGLGSPWCPRGGFGAGRAEDQFRWLESSAGPTLCLQAPLFIWFGLLPMLTLLLWHFSERDHNSEFSAQMMPFLQCTLGDSVNGGFLQRNIPGNSSLDALVFNIRSAQAAAFVSPWGQFLFST